MVELQDLAKNVGYTTFIMLFVSLIGIFYLAVNSITAGMIYIFLFLLSVAIIVLIFGLSKNNETVDNALEFLREYDAPDMKTEVRLYLAGLGTILISLLLKKVFSFSITDYSIPLFKNMYAQSYSVANTLSSMAWKNFIVMFTAGTQESFVYLIVAVLMGIIIAWFIAKLITDDEDSFWHSKAFIYAITIIFTVAVFVGSHILNSDYKLDNFYSAGIFMFIQVVTVIIYPKLFVFWLGYHQSNNLLFLSIENGWLKVGEGFLSLFGVFFVILLILLIYYALRKSK